MLIAVRDLWVCHALRLSRLIDMRLHCRTKSAACPDRVKPCSGLRDLVYAWLVSTVLSGLPSTLHALVTGADPLKATRAAGAMLLPAATETLTMVVEARPSVRRPAAGLGLLAHCFPCSNDSRAAAYLMPGTRAPEVSPSTRPSAKATDRR